MESITVGLDLAKQVFSVCIMEANGRVTLRRELKRDGLPVFLAQQPAGTVVAMEACSSAHYWGRVCLSHGLQPRLMAAQFVKPFRKSAVIKNDRNDAEAIATAARQGNMRFTGSQNHGSAGPFKLASSARGLQEGCAGRDQPDTRLACRLTSR